MSNPLARYLRDLHDDHRLGEAAVEVSGYGTLQTLINAFGSGLNPGVRVVINPKNRGSGTPDGGLFTTDQFQREARDTGEWPAQLPNRGAVEVKGPQDDVVEIAASEQVGRYLLRYGQVLVTNYRDFLLVGQDGDGSAKHLERFTLAPSVDKFWRLAGSRARDEELEARFREFFIRTLAYGAPLRRAEDLAWFLASYAREALLGLESRSGGGERELRLVRDALRQALGVGFEGEEGEHFFRSTLVQTLFYGVFSAWVLWSKRTPFGLEERFNWRLAVHTLNVPLIRSLFEQLTLKATMKALGMQEIMERTGELLNRVEREAFFEDFAEDGAVQYFYEPFLAAFDPELRRQLGVWYTPKEVVRYMVERVDQALKDDLEIPAGLADEDVFILDPCCGTGAYLVEVIQKIDRTLRESGADALSAHDLRRAALERVFGFEILPAPFVVAHLQLGLLLQNLGAPLSDGQDERASVYLTNALTGWEPRDDAKSNLPLIEFEEEREAADEIKQRKKILVVLGNPPYYPYSGVSVEEEGTLVSPYRTATKGPKPAGQGLNDLYVRFFRVAERQIAESSGRGIVCYISNYSWLDGRSHPGMRERYVDAFDSIRVDRLNGDSRKNGKVAGRNERPERLLDEGEQRRNPGRDGDHHAHQEARTLEDFGGRVPRPLGYAQARGADPVPR